MKKLLLLVLFLTVSLTLAAQQRTSTLRGMVIDEANGEPLIGALVLVDSAKHGTVDLKGAFSITGIPRGERTVEVSFLGYGTVTRKVDFSQATVNLGTVRLKEEGRNIDAVVVTGDATAVIQKGDTTQFNAAAFPTSADAYAGDLINKLPGAEVSGSTVIVQGDTVKRVKIDGKMFFGDDVMSAMNNLPVDVIENIQMFDEQTDEAKFAGYDDGRRQRTLNIVTRNKASQMVTANLEAGYGMQLEKEADGKRMDHYLLSGVVNMFSEKQRWTLNASSNNVGRSGRMRGGRGGGSGGGLTTSNSVGLDYSADWNTKWRLNANYTFNENRTKSESWNEREYAQTENSDVRIERTDSEGRSETNNHTGSVRLEYTGERDRIMFMGRGNYSLNDGNNRSLSQTSVGNDLISKINSPSLSNSDNLSAFGFLSWTHKLGEKAGRAITLNVNGNVNDAESDNDQEKNSEVGGMSTHTVTTTDSWSRGYNGRVTYAEPISERSRITVNYTLTRLKSKRTTEAWDRINDEKDEALSRTTLQNRLEHAVGLGYMYNTDAFRFGFGLDFKSSEQKNEDLYPKEKEMDHTFNTWQPYATARYMVDRSKYFDFRYNGRAQAPALSDLQNVLTENGTRYSVGNPDLKQSYTHEFRLNYNASNPQKSTNFNVSANAALTDNSIANKTTYFDRDTVLAEYNDKLILKGSQLSQRVNLSGAVRLWANANYSFLFRPLKTRVSVGPGYSYNRTPSYQTVNGENNTKEQLLNYANVHEGSVNVRFTSAISENVDFTISSRTQLAYADNSALSNSRTWRETVSAEISVVLLRRISYNTSFNWNYQHNFNGKRNNTTNTYVWNMGLGYKFLRRRTAEFRVTIYDIMNQSQKAPVISYQETYQSTSWSRSLGRYAMATLSYRFNSMHRGGSSAVPAVPGGAERRMGPPEGGTRMRMGAPGGGPPPGGMGPGGF